jgi:hypothetical protein
MKTTDREKAIRLMTTSREKAIRLAEELFRVDQVAGTLHENGEDAMIRWYQSIHQAEGDDALEPFREHRQAMEAEYDRLLEEERGETSEHVHNVHEAVSTEERPFSECVSPHDCNGAAHGCIELREACSCGASRRVNVNQQHAESGPWVEPETSEDTEHERDPMDDIRDEIDYPTVKIGLTYECQYRKPGLWNVRTDIDGEIEHLGGHERMERALLAGLEWLRDHDFVTTDDYVLWDIDIQAGESFIRIRPFELERRARLLEKQAELPPK